MAELPIVCKISKSTLIVKNESITCFLVLNIPIDGTHKSKFYSTGQIVARGFYYTLHMFEAKLQTDQYSYLLILLNNSVIQSFNVSVIIAEEYLLKQQ